MKIAFLIIAHDHPEILRFLISKLSHPSFYLYIHIDKKANFNIKKFINSYSSDHVFFIKSKKVEWGKYSQISTPLNLLKASLPGSYDFYYLLSGTDLPIKTNDYILKFFQQNKDYQFIQIFTEQQMNEGKYLRNRVYEFNIMPRGSNNKILKIINYFFILLHKINIYPNKKISWSYFRKGSAFYAINRDFAQYLLRKKKLIHKLFKFSTCGDEMYVQTIFHNSNFKKVKDTLTYADWSAHKASPEIINSNHVSTLKKSNCLFARKFSDDYVNFYNKIFD